LTAIVKDGRWPITGSAYLITDRYEVTVSIADDVATVLLASIRQSEHQQLFTNDTFVTRKQKQLIGQFKMELGTNGLPDKNTIEMAKYLISLFKANPQNGIENNILLTNNLTKLQVRQQFKNVTGMTGVEDMFIGLSQAKERQEIKDYVDILFSTMMFENSNIDNGFTQMAQITGANTLYTKLMQVLLDKQLKLKKITFGVNSSANGKYDTYSNILIYEMNSSAFQNVKITDAKTLVHELLHAYVDLISGKPLGVKQDEGMAYALEHGYFSMTTGIYKNLYKVESYLKAGNMTEALTEWNLLVNGNTTKSIEDVMTTTAYQYKLYWGLKEYSAITTKTDFRRLEEYTGFGLSLNKLKQVADYLNETYNTNIFTIKDNTISY
jgi:hypothetical protein